MFTLFFFLSGYLITTLFYSEYKSGKSSIDIFRFYARRWLRLTPPLLITVLIGIEPSTVQLRIGVDGTPVPLGTTMATLLYYTNYYDLAWAMGPFQGYTVRCLLVLGECEEHFLSTCGRLVIKKSIHDSSRLLAIIVGACVHL